MSTRSFIEQELPGAQRRRIYCHFDGYPDAVGVILREYYSTPERVEQLMELGSISSLGKELGPAPKGAESIYDYTRAYHRDDGFDYDMEKAMVFKEGEDPGGYVGVDHSYLYKEGQWYTSPMGEDGYVKWVPMSEYISSRDLHQRIEGIIEKAPSDDTFLFRLIEKLALYLNDVEGITFSDLFELVKNGDVKWEPSGLLKDGLLEYATITHFRISDSGDYLNEEMVSDSHLTSKVYEHALKLDKSSYVYKGKTYNGRDVVKLLTFVAEDIRAQ